MSVKQKKHLGLYSSEFPGLHLPAMEALWLYAPEISTDSCFPSLEMKASQDPEIIVSILVLLSLPSACIGAVLWGPTDPTISVATDHLFLVSSSSNKFLDGSWLMADQPWRPTEMHPPVQKKTTRKLNCNEKERTGSALKEETSSKQATRHQRKEKREKPY